MNINIAVAALLVILAWTALSALLALAIAPAMRSDLDPVEGEGWGGDIHGQRDARNQDCNHG